MFTQQLPSPESRLAAAKRDLGLPIVVAICGSTRFMNEMTEAELQETAAGRIVVKPGCDLKRPHPLWADPARADRLKIELDDLHRAKIRLCDEVLVVGDYVGDSTCSEIRYARAVGKPVRFTHPAVDPDPAPLPVVQHAMALAVGGALLPPAVEPGTLVVAVGPPASGKSTAVARWFPATWRVSLDAYRGWLTDSEADQGASEEALAIRALVLEGRLRRGLTTVCDSTSITAATRADLLARAVLFDRPAIAVLFDTPLEVCEARNAARERTVPVDVLREMHAQLPTADQLLGEGFTAVHHIGPTPKRATMSKDTIAPERIAAAVAVLRKAQEGDEEAHEGLAEFFPEYEGLVMQTDHTRYLKAAADAGMVATHLLVMQYGKGVWGTSVDTYTADFEMPLASVNLGDYPSRTEAIREAVTAATNNGWTLAPEQDWTDYDCGGGEIHIPIHARPSAPTL